MLLEARNLHVGYGDATAIWDVSLDVDAGEIVSVIGPNGAGKTTLINAMAGLLRCRKGELRFDGAEIGRDPAHEIARRGVARSYQIPRPFANMTVLENVVLAASFGMEISSPFRWGGGAVIRDGGGMSDTLDAAHDPSARVRRGHLPI